MRSPMFDLIKRMHEEGFNGYATVDGLKKFVRTGWITAEEFEEITGVPYTP
jgi:hypothetical protein